VSVYRGIQIMIHCTTNHGKFALICTFILLFFSKRRTGKPIV